MRVLLVCHDAGGTVPPVVALADALVRGGHDVTVLSQPSVRTRARSAGATFVPFSTLPDYRARTRFDDQLDLIGAAIVGRPVGDDLLAIDADLVVVDANLGGALAAAETLDVPTAVLLHSMWASFTDTWFSELWPLLGGAVNDVRRSFGRDDVDGWPGVFGDHDRLISVVPPGFDAPSTVPAPPTLRHAGFLVCDEAPIARAFPDGDGPTVLVALSTTYQAHEALLHTIVDALGRMRVRALVTTAGQVDIGASPGNVRVVERIAHGAVLPDADVVITHAGLGTVAAALHHGVPLLCTPIDRDQPLNASRVDALGAGIALTSSPTVDEVRHGLLDLLDVPSFRDGARRVAQASADAGGAAAAARDLVALAS